MPRRRAAAVVVCAVPWGPRHRRNSRPRVQIKGIFIQLLFYAGIPATVFGLRIAHEVINERAEWRDQDVPLDVEWINGIEDKLKRGSALSAAYREVTQEQADKEGGQMPFGAGTLAGSVHFMNFHESYHIGQLCYLACWHGKPRFA